MISSRSSFSFRRNHLPVNNALISRQISSSRRHLSHVAKPATKTKHFKIESSVVWKLSENPFTFRISSRSLFCFRRNHFPVNNALVSRQISGSGRHLSHVAKPATKKSTSKLRVPFLWKIKWESFHFQDFFKIFVFLSAKSLA